MLTPVSSSNTLKRKNVKNLFYIETELQNCRAFNFFEDFHDVCDT